MNTITLTEINERIIYKILHLHLYFYIDIERGLDMNLKGPMKEFYSELLKHIPENIKEENVTNFLDNVIEKMLNETTPIMVDDLRKSQGEMLEDQRLLRAEFEARLHRRWSKPLALLETLIVISLESSEELYKENISIAKSKSNIKFEVLIKIHARACQISYEILALLRSGFADGAMTRWRTLHELAVLSFFISQNDNDVAQMYLDYEFIERYYEMLEYIKYAPILGYSELPKEDIDELTSKRAELIHKYGNEFEKPYGWTLNVLDKKNRNFKALEENIQLDHLRPYYKLACNYVHLGPKASSFSLGNIEGSKIIIAGASNYGLANPGQNACLSLTQITTCLLTSYPTFEALMTCKIMDKFSSEACELFVEVQKQIELEEDNYIDELEINERFNCHH
ncbi:DUF5677 domain-containing protein [Paenibacillus lautus]|uniref:DUF5677 domain-containing protein n=1 Tax=Paenibacillus lautus TaxID=1401 RepID=UPI002DB9A155|nr:DUF5677 domain-containing protein [Paenibacillus lautus]MEC0311368.1 DUF5677 domain-containing protein [Paenibacillus lautus]